MRIASILWIGYRWGWLLLRFAHLHYLSASRVLYRNLWDPIPKSSVLSKWETILAHRGRVCHRCFDRIARNSFNTSPVFPWGCTFRSYPWTHFNFHRSIGVVQLVRVLAPWVDYPSVWPFISGTPPSVTITYNSNSNSNISLFPNHNLIKPSIKQSKQGWDIYLLKWGSVKFE